jgi:arylsulfatase A-like enzyme
LSAPEVSDLAAEGQSVHKLYGTDDPNKYTAAYARNCLLARRLLERGVRYVNLYCASRASGVDGLLNWDAHKTLKADYERHCPIFDKPTAALITDLKSLGLLDDTLVLWTTEFGRMPTHQAETKGRDHNPDGFTCWMMGAGVKAGVSYGATDEFGRRAQEKPTTVWDFYATVLHLLGLDHERLTFYHNGLDRRLTDVHGRVIREIIDV